VPTLNAIDPSIPSDGLQAATNTFAESGALSVKKCPKRRNCRGTYYETAPLALETDYTTVVRSVPRR